MNAPSISASVIGDVAAEESKEATTGPKPAAGTSGAEHADVPWGAAFMNSFVDDPIGTELGLGNDNAERDRAWNQRDRTVAAEAPKPEQEPDEKPDEKLAEDEASTVALVAPANNAKFGAIQQTELIRLGYETELIALNSLSTALRSASGEKRKTLQLQRL